MPCARVLHSSLEAGKETPMQDRTDIRLNAPTAEDDREESGSGEDLADLSYTPRQDEDDALA